MKAVFIERYGPASSSLGIRNCVDPIPSAHEVLIETEAFGINFADVVARKGLYKPAPAPPFIPGYEVCGKIIAVGSDGNKHLLGKRVASFTRFGGYAQKCLAPAVAVIPVADHVPAADACALCTQYATAWFALHESVIVRENEKILIYAGAGGVGIALTQLARLKNCHITAVVGTENKVSAARNAGADCVVIEKEKYYGAAWREKTGGKFDVIFNPVYGKSFKSDLKMLDTGGRIISYGASSRLHYGKSNFLTILYALGSGKILPVFLIMRSQTIAGVNMLEIGDNKPHILKKCMEEVFKLYGEGKIKPEVQTFPVTDIQHVHDDLEKRKTTGKLVIHW